MSPWQRFADQVSCDIIRNNIEALHVRTEVYEGAIKNYVARIVDHKQYGWSPQSLWISWLASDAKILRSIADQLDQAHQHLTERTGEAA